MNTSEKKQLKAESTEVQCPECKKISYQDDWEYINTRAVQGVKCPACGAICDVE